MYIPEKLKLNKFRQVDIPANRDYFARYGMLEVPASKYSGDESMPVNESKIDSIIAGQRFAEGEMVSNKDIND